MNTKFNKILSVLATVAIVASSLVWAMPVAASTPGDGQWTIQDLPSATNNVLLNNSSILDIAVGSDGKTVYVADALAGSYIMKTSDAGQSFDNVQNNYAGVAPVAISVAPDDVATAAVVDAAGAVYITKDGGTTWSTLPSPLAAPYVGATVTDIAVAPARSGTLLGREYIVSLADPLAAAVNRGDVLIIGTGASWTPVIQEGVQVVTVAAPWGAGAGTYSLNYINQAGAAKTSANFVIPAASVAGTTVAIVLAAGDTCGKVTGVNVGVAAGAGDTFNIRGTTTNFIFANITNGAIGTSTLNGRADYTQVVFTPNFLGDRSVVAIGTGVAVGSTVAQIVNTATNTLIQTAAINVIAGANTVDFVTVAAGNSIITSSIALPTNFDPTSTSGRRFYVGLASNGAIDNDVYRIDDNSVKALGAVGGAAQVKSVAYNGTTDTGILLVGQMASTDVKYTTGMTSTSPTWTTTLKGPTGAAVPAVVVQVASDYATTSRVFAGTLGAESGFSVSNDAGVSFNQEALVNCGATNTGNPSLSFASDTKSVFLSATDANNNIVIWKSAVPFTATSWSRIFAKPLVNIANGSSLKKSGSAIFFFETTTVNGPIYVSQDDGVSFNTRNGPTGVGYSTAVARDAQTVYYCDTASGIYKSVNGAWTWSTAVPSNVGRVRSIILPKANQVVAGGTGGVAVSNDDALTFTAMTSGLTVAGTSRFSVVADTKYADNNIIYTADVNTPAAAGTNWQVYRVKTDNTSNTFEVMSINLAAGAGAGLILGVTTRSGVLYVSTDQLSAGAVFGGVLRTLTPTDLVGNQNWQSLSTGLPAGLSATITTTAGINLYGRQGTNIYAFNDYLATTKPTLTEPADNYADAINPTGGNGYPIDLKLKPMGSGTGQVDRVDIEIVDKANGLTGTPTWAFQTISPTNPVITVGGPTAAAGSAFQPNKTYLWRIRAARVSSNQLIDSPWSDARTINIQAGSAVSQQYAGPVLLGPQGGAQNLDPNLVGFAWAPVSGATEYTVIVSTDPALTMTVAGTPAKVTVPAYQATGLVYGTTYFWAVQATKPTSSVQTMGTFTTMQKPVPVATVPAGGAVQPTIIVQAPVAETPSYIWAVIAIGAILVIAVIILIVRTRRVP